MAQIESWVEDRLAASADLTALVSTRIYPVTVPQGKDNIPAVIYFRLSTNRTYINLRNDGRPTTTIRIVAVSNSYKKSKQILDVLRPLFDGYSGINASDHAVSKTTISEEADDFEVPQFGDERLRYKSFIDVEIKHKESVTQYL